MNRVRQGIAVVTAAGWLLTAVVAVAVVVGAWAGWVEAWTVAAVGAVCLLVAVVAVVGRHLLRVAVDLSHERVRVGQTARGAVQVVNPSRGRSRAVTLELPVGEGVLPLAVPGLPGGRDWVEEFAVPARRRGVVRIGPPRTVRGDALGLTRTERAWGEPSRLIVHPELVRVPFDATGFQADIEGVTTARLSSSDVSFHALREYTPGDDRRYVHWPSTARTGRLMLRHFEETRRSHHLIVLDTADTWLPDDFEVAVSVAASLAVGGLLQRRPVSVFTATGQVSTATPLRLLDALTEVQPVPDGDDADTVVRRAVWDLRAVSVLTVIGTDALADGQAGRWSRLAGADVVTGLVRVGAGLSADRRTLGPVSVVDCPRLSDLPRLIGRRA